MTTPTEVKPVTPPATPPEASKQTPAAPPPAAKEPPKTEANKPEVKPLLAADDPPPTQPKSEAPEVYKFVAPEGADPASLELYEVVARDMGLSQETAQKMLDRIAPAIAEKANAVAAARLERLAAEVKAHPQLGGANLDATLVDAKRALDQLGNPRLRELLRDPRVGAGSDVGLIEFLATIARRFLRTDELLREERRGTPPATGADDEDYAARYPKMTARMKATRGN